ncbi:hypothetical protein BGZ49_010400 [Haplosporangium sp. Z 27]|nr:hypothetical protein BGZ49_010400 [Haplosporangium sp. Z 27]
MSDLSVVYRELLASEEGDILVKLKNGSQLKIISFLLKQRSPVFKTMLESSMKEAATGVIDLSSQYSLEAFREFMAYIYYNKLYAGSFVPLLFELLCIITNVPICLTIAYEAQKHGALTSIIYSVCIGFLVRAAGPPKHECYSTMNKSVTNYGKYQYIVHGQVARLSSTIHNAQGYYDPISSSAYRNGCCEHCSKASESVDIDQLPDFIVDDVKAKINDVKAKINNVNSAKVNNVN